jgi:RNA polymerase sigma-70 factor (ECF subfamily)
MGEAVRREGEAATADQEAGAVRRAIGGDTEAFADLVSRYRGALEGILAPLARDDHQVQDFVQEAILRARRNLPKYSEEYRFSTWFFRIGVNLAISERRRQRVELRLREPAIGARVPGPEAVEDPLDALLREEDVVRLRSALQRLPQRYQDVLHLRYGEQMSCQEIAARMETTPNTISIVLFRAKSRLRKDLER